MKRVGIVAVVLFAASNARPQVGAAQSSWSRARAWTASFGPVWPHPASGAGLECLGAPPRNSFMGAQLHVSVKQGRVEAMIRDTYGLSPDFRDLAARLGVVSKDEVVASWRTADCRLSPTGRWQCVGRARIELVGVIVRGEKPPVFEADALLLADSAAGFLVTKQGGRTVRQEARFSPGECRSLP